MTHHCDDLTRLGFSLAEPPAAGLSDTGVRLALATRTYEPGVATFVTYLPVYDATARRYVEHPTSTAPGCWHGADASLDLTAVRESALRHAIRALDADIDQWEVRGQFAFADPDLTSHRWHAQKSRLRLSALRYEVGRVDRECEEFPRLEPDVRALRQRISDAYSLLAEMTASSLADKSDIEESQRSRLNLLLSIIASLILAPGVVISFASATTAHSDPVTLLLACASASLVTAAIIVAFSGLRLDRRRRGAAVSVVAGAAALLVALLVATAVPSPHGDAIVVTVVLAIGFLLTLVAPWGRRTGAASAPDRWRSTWDSIRNDRERSWRELNDGI